MFKWVLFKIVFGKLATVGVDEQFQKVIKKLATVYCWKLFKILLIYFTYFGLNMNHAANVSPESW